MDGERVGSVFVVKKTDEIAKLRLLIIDPKARGLGLGKRLVDECLRFAREAGYKSMTLWTQSILVAARGIYARAGFKLVAKEPHRSFGADLIGETWERDL
jgi:ribosomal protein S18 acetylase RimI-like enzyme